MALKRKRDKTLNPGNSLFARKMGYAAMKVQAELFDYGIGICRQPVMDAPFP